MIQAIKDELAANPTTYDSLSNADTAVAIRSVTKEVNRTSISGSELLGLAVSSEYASLTDIQRDNWLSLCGVDSINPFGSASNLVQNIWQGNPLTIAALVSARTETTYPFANVKEGHIIEARL